MLWIKEPANANEQISGTVYMVTVNDGKHEEENELKQTSAGVILSPQPQNNANDPLNWPVWRRDIALVTISIHALLVGGMTPILAPVMGTLEVQFNKKLTDLTYLVGVYMVSMGVGSVFFAPVAVVYGKRLIYLVSLVVMLGGLFWAANATSYSSLMGARVLTGIGGSPAESLPSTTIAEIFFAHERAYRLGIYTLLLIGGKNLSPLASAFIANRLKWHWIFWISAIICGFVLVCSFLFVHETFWDRTPLPDKRSQKESELAAKARAERQLPPWTSDMCPDGLEYPVDEDEIQVVHLHTVPSVTHASPLQSHTDTNTDAHEGTEGTESPAPYTPQATAYPAAGEADDNKSLQKHNTRDTHDSESFLEEERRTRVPFFKNLGIYTGRKTSTPLYKVFLRPFVLLLYPSVIFSTLVYSTSVVWLSVIAETISTIFSHEPYNFKQTSVGLLYVALFVGGFLGSAVAGKFSDVVVRWMCRKNNGIYEPEFRLVMILPVFLSITIGLMGFGWSAKEGDLWIVPAVFMGILGFGCSLASTVSITYVVDCYRVFASESLVSLNLVKNILGLAFSIFVPYFFQASGSKISYIVYGCIEIGLCIFAIPVYRYGKIMRQHFDDKQLMRNLY